MTNSRDAEPRGSKRKGPSYGLSPRTNTLPAAGSFLEGDFSGIQSTDELLISLTATLGRSDSLHALGLDEIDHYADAFIAGMQIYHSMAIFDDMAEGSLSDASRSFMENYETAAAYTTAWLASLQRGDIKAYLTFENKFTNPAFGGLDVKDVKRIIATPNSSISVDVVAASAAVASLNGKTDPASIQNAVLGRSIERVKQTLTPVQEEDGRTWDRLSTSWEAQQVFDALDLIPDLSGVDHESTIAALEDNLLSGQVRFSPTDYESLNVEGIKSLFAFRWTDSDLLDRIRHRYPNLQEAVREEEIAADNLTLRELGPSAAIELIWSVVKDTDPTNRSAALTRIHDTIGADKNFHNVWLLTLLTIHHRDPSMIEVKGLIERWEDIPANVRATILDEVPGNVYLTPDGKIVARQTSLKKGIRLYEGKAGQEEQSTEKDTNGETDESVNTEGDEEDDTDTEPIVSGPEIIPTEQEVAVLPFFGDVGLTSKEAVQNTVINVLQAPPFSLDIDAMDRSIASDKRRWQQHPKLRKKHAPFYHLLNDGDTLFTDAAKAGIHGVVVEGYEVTLILDLATYPARAEERTVRAGIRLHLDDEGNVTVPGIEDEEFMQLTEAGLFIQNLALHAATREFAEPPYDKITNQRLNILAQKFNTNPRRDQDLPRLKNAAGAHIPIFVAEWNSSFFLAEK